MLNVLEVQDAIVAHLRASIPHEVFEQGIPDADTVRRDASGKVMYYVAIQLGMPQAKATGKTYMGVEHDDYVQPVYVQVVGADAKKVRQAAFGAVHTALLGFSTKWTAQLEQRAGGAIYPMTQSNNSTEAYVVPLSYGITFQMNP